jgi:hypothetical protein
MVCPHQGVELAINTLSTGHSDECEAHLALVQVIFELVCVHAEVINKTSFLLLMMAILNYRVLILGIKSPNPFTGKQFWRLISSFYIVNCLDIET